MDSRVDSEGSGYAVTETPVETEVTDSDPGKTVTVETATVSVETMLMTVVANERVGTGAPTVTKTVSGAQVAAPLEVEGSQHLLKRPSRLLLVDRRTSVATRRHRLEENLLLSSLGHGKWH